MNQALTQTSIWAGLGGVVVTLITQLQHSSAFDGWLGKCRRQVRILFPIALSAVNGLLSYGLGSANWSEAVVVTVGTAATSVLVAEGLLSGAAGIRNGPSPTEPQLPPADYIKALQEIQDHLAKNPPQVTP